MKHDYHSLCKELVNIENKDYIIKWAFLYGYYDGEPFIHQPQKIKIIKVDWGSRYYTKYEFFDDDAQSSLKYLDDDLDKFIYIFDDEKECIEAYNNEVWNDIKYHEDKAKSYQQKANKMKENMFINSDYIIEKLRRSI